MASDPAAAGQAPPGVEGPCKRQKRLEASFEMRLFFVGSPPGRAASDTCKEHVRHVSSSTLSCQHHCDSLRRAEVECGWNRTLIVASRFSSTADFIEESAARIGCESVVPGASGESITELVYRGDAFLYSIRIGSTEGVQGLTG